MLVVDIDFSVNPKPNFSNYIQITENLSNIHRAIKQEIMMKFALEDEKKVKGGACTYRLIAELAGKNMNKIYIFQLSVGGSSQLSIAHILFLMILNKCQKRKDKRWWIGTI